MSNIEEFNDQQHLLEDLKKSYEVIGALHPAIHAYLPDGTDLGIIAGNNRLKAVKSWPVEKMVVKDKLEAYRKTIGDNLHVKKDATWWTKVVNAMAKEMEKEGTPNDQVLERMRKESGLNDYHLYRYIHSSYKQVTKPVKKDFDVKISDGPMIRRDEERPHNGTIEEVRNGYVDALTGPLAREPFRKGLSPQASTFQVKTMTLPHLKLVSALNAAHVDCRVEEPYDRNQTNTKGDHLFYSTDIFLLKRQDVVIEVKGEGSKTDDPKRMAWFKDRNIKVVSFTNEHVNAWSRELAEAIKGFLS